MKAEINKQCPKIAMKKGLTYLDPCQKTQHPCTAGAGTGSMHGEGRDGWHGNRDGSDAGSSLSPSILRHVSVSSGGRAGSEGQ